MGILRALLPYMLQNSKLGLVRSKQGFYNIPNPSGHSFATFINSMEPVEDARSGFLMRRAGLDDIGGFPTGASVEDGQITALLQGKGYETHFVDEALTYGLIPDSFSVHLKQRLSRSELSCSLCRNTAHMVYSSWSNSHCSSLEWLPSWLSHQIYGRSFGISLCLPLNIVCSLSGNAVALSMTR